MHRALHTDGRNSFSSARHGGFRHLGTRAENAPLLDERLHAIKDQCIPHDDSEALVIVLRGRLDVVRSAWEKRRNSLCNITQVSRSRVRGISEVKYRSSIVSGAIQRIIHVGDGQWLI
jgi:hypothetical protein